MWEKRSTTEGHGDERARGSGPDCPILFRKVMASALVVDPTADRGLGMRSRDCLGQAERRQGVLYILEYLTNGRHCYVTMKGVLTDNF